MKGAVVVLVTCPVAKAGPLATALVDERLAACVNVLPKVTSIYRWKGKPKRDVESLLVIKTRRASFEALRARVVELHPYEVPEVIALPIEAGHAPYLQWLMNQSERD